MMRIVCCGNRNRGDDAAAILVAERVQQRGIPVEIYEGDPLAILDSWNRSDDVIVVDAMVTGAPTGAVEVWEVPLPTNFSGARASTHGLGIGEALDLAQVLGRLPRRLRVYGIEGKEFGPGAGLSSEVKQAAENVAEQIAAQWRPSSPTSAAPLSETHGGGNQEALRPEGQLNARPTLRESRREPERT